jgi:hypothetical protein
MNDFAGSLDHQRTAGCRAGQQRVARALTGLTHRFPRATRPGRLRSMLSFRANAADPSDPPPRRRDWLPRIVWVVQDDTPACGMSKLTAIERSRAGTVALVACNAVGERVAVNDRCAVRVGVYGRCHGGRGLGRASHRAIVRLFHPGYASRTCKTWMALAS